MVHLIAVALAFIWGVITASLFLRNKRSAIRRQFNIVQYLGYKEVNKEALDLGWNISRKEFLGMVCFAIAIGVMLATIFRNPLIIIAGLVAGYYLPRLIIKRYKKHERLTLMTAIPDFGRILIARLVDHHSIVRAFEVSQHDVSGPMKKLTEDFIKDAAIGIGVQPALENLKAKVSFRKFNTFIETLLIAHQEGYSKEALQAMEKSIEAVENDVKAIETLEITTRKKKRELFYVIIASWAFPIVLSFMNTDNANIYMDTLSGKVLIFSYILATMVVLIKGEDYLSLKLDEL